LKSGVILDDPAQPLSDLALIFNNEYANQVIGWLMGKAFFYFGLRVLIGHRGEIVSDGSRNANTKNMGYP
jgi:hypothetical protein